MPGSTPDSPLTQAIVTLFVVALVARRTLTTQTMRVSNLPVFAVVLVVAIGFAIIVLPPSPYTPVAIAIGIVLGVGLGYVRGRHSVVTPGAKPGTIRVKASPLLSGIVIAAVLARGAMKYIFPADSPVGTAVVAGSLAFAALSLALARMMLFVAARRVIAPTA